MRESVQKYHLSCDSCMRLFWTEKAFPEPQYCPQCLAVKTKGYRAGVEAMRDALLPRMRKKQEHTYYTYNEYYSGVEDAIDITEDEADKLLKENE